MVYMIFICLVPPLLLMIFLLEKQPRILVTFMVIGMLVCLGACEIDSLFYSLFNMGEAEFTTYVTPITEEIIKAIPVLFYAFVISDKRKNIITVSLAVGIGFAILENAYIMVTNYQNIEMSWVIIRGFAVAIMHGICTATVGYGTIFIYKRKKLFYTGTFGLLCCAITYHSIYNMLVQSNYSYIGFAMPILTYALIMFIIKRDKISNFIKKKRILKPSI